MKKILLLCLTCCLTLCVIIISCTKSVKIPIEYSVTDTSGIDLPDIYIPDSGVYEFPVWVKFLTGDATDKVTLTFSGLPADVRVTPESYSAVPSYTKNFVFYTNHAVKATYPITLTAYSSTAGYKEMHFNLGVIPAECAKAFIGPLNGSNACDVAGKYHYEATAETSPFGTNEMYVRNFGGYGPNVSVLVILDCATDSVFIPLDNYGNNVTMEGKGIFTDNKMIIWYQASNTPGGFADACVDTLTR